MTRRELEVELAKYPEDADIVHLKHDDSVPYEVNHVVYSPKDNEIILC